jgi:hypothetical protein
MLYLFIHYLLVSGICLWVGTIIYTLVPSPDNPKKSVIQYLITGMIGVTALGQWIALFQPLRAVSLLIILLCCGIITLFRKMRIQVSLREIRSELWNKSAFFYLSLFCFLVMIIVLNAGPTIMDDTDSYHIQMVKWVREFGSVPGIANLHLRFGFNSSWFISIASFSYGHEGVNNYTALNGLLYLYFGAEKFPFA